MRARVGSHCASVRRRIPLFVGGDLAPDERESVRVHLRDCSSCRSEAGRQLRALQALRALPAAGDQPLPGGEQAFFAALQADCVRAAAVAGPPGRRWRRRVVRWSGLVAAALLWFALGLWVGSPSGGLSRRPAIRPTDAGAAPAAIPGGIVLQPLSYPGDATGDLPAPGPGGGPGPGLGLYGRIQLRTLEGHPPSLLVDDAAWDRRK